MKIEEDILKGKKYIQSKNFDKAFEVFSQLREQLNNDNSVNKVLILQNLAFLYKEENKFEDGKNAIKEAIDLLKGHDYQPLSYKKQLLGNAYSSLSNILLKENKESKENDIVSVLEEANSNYIYCLENRYLYSESDKEENSENHANILTKLSLQSIKKRDIQKGKFYIELAINIWQMVPKYNEKQSFTLTSLCFALINIIIGNHEKGVELLQKIKSQLQKKHQNDYNIYNLYLSSIVLLLHMYKQESSKKDQVEELKKDMQKSLEEIKERAQTDQNFQLIYKQYMLLQDNFK